MFIEEDDYKTLEMLLNLRMKNLKMTPAEVTAHYENNHKRSELNRAKIARWDQLFACEPVAKSLWLKKVWAYGANDEHIDTALRRYFNHKK